MASGLGGLPVIRVIDGDTLVVNPGEDEFVVAMLTDSMMVWRESRAEREQRMQMQGLGALVCPTCGYNLMGLREAHCPECGSRFTLDQLYAFQRLEQRSF